MEIKEKRKHDNPEMETCWKLTPSRKIFIFKPLYERRKIKSRLKINTTIGMLAARE
jgi:hypothetical protein